MSILCFLIGLILGNILYDVLIRRLFFVSRKKIGGQIDIDHNTYLSRVKTYDDFKLLDKNTKYILFKVNHDAKISTLEKDVL